MYILGQLAKKKTAIIIFFNLVVFYKFFLKGQYIIQKLTKTIAWVI